MNINRRDALKLAGALASGILIKSQLETQGEKEKRTSPETTQAVRGFEVAIISEMGEEIVQRKALYMTWQGRILTNIESVEWPVFTRRTSVGGLRIYKDGEVFLEDRLQFSRFASPGDSASIPKGSVILNIP